MLNDLHRRDKIKLTIKIGNIGAAIVNLQTCPLRMLVGRRDVFGRRIHTDDIRAKPSERLTQQACTATNINRGLASQRPNISRIKSPMDITCRTNESQADGIELVQHGG